MRRRLAQFLLDVSHYAGQTPRDPLACLLAFKLLATPLSGWRAQGVRLVG